MAGATRATSVGFRPRIIKSTTSLGPPSSRPRRSAFWLSALNKSAVSAWRTSICMKAAFINQTGPPENIIYGDLPEPKPGPSQCLVKVGATALNPIDTYLRSGGIKMQLPLPFIVGCDLAGTVAAVGANVKRFKPGDRVW